MLGHHRPASETPFRWRTDDGPVLVLFGSSFLSKNIVVRVGPRVGPPLAKLSGSAHVQGEIENTRWTWWMSFDIKFTRQGFENACWHREACRAIQHAFSKPNLINLISKDANLVFYLSVYPLLNTLQTRDYDVFFLFLCWFSVISDVIQKVQRDHDLIGVACREIGNVY